MGKKLNYEIIFVSVFNNRITLTNLDQSPVQDRWANIIDAKRQLIHRIKKHAERGEFSLEEQKQIKKRISQINKLTKNSPELAKEMNDRKLRQVKEDEKRNKSKLFMERVIRISKEYGPEGLNKIINLIEKNNIKKYGDE